MNLMSSKQISKSVTYSFSSNFRWVSAPSNPQTAADSVGAVCLYSRCSNHRRLNYWRYLKSSCLCVDLEYAVVELVLQFFRCRSTLQLQHTCLRGRSQLFHFLMAVKLQPHFRSALMWKSAHYFLLCILPNFWGLGSRFEWIKLNRR